MADHAHDLFPRANQANDHLDGKRDHLGADTVQVVDFDEQVRLLCKSVWPTKTASHLSIYGDVTVRQAERLLARQQGFSTAVIRRLAHCSFGGPFHRLFMDGCKEPHWIDMIGDRDIGDLERQAAEMLRQAAELKKQRGRR